MAQDKRHPHRQQDLVLTAAIGHLLAQALRRQRLRDQVSRGHNAEGLAGAG